MEKDATEKETERKQQQTQFVRICVYDQTKYWFAIIFIAFCEIASRKFS